MLYIRGGTALIRIIFCFWEKKSRVIQGIEFLLLKSVIYFETAQREKHITYMGRREYILWMLASSNSIGKVQIPLRKKKDLEEMRGLPLVM